MVCLGEVEIGPSATQVRKTTSLTSTVKKNIEKTLAAKNEDDMSLKYGVDWKEDFSRDK